MIFEMDAMRRRRFLRGFAFLCLFLFISARICCYLIAFVSYVWFHRSVSRPFALPSYNASRGALDLPFGVEIGVLWDSLFEQQGIGLGKPAYGTDLFCM
jgi:hypothetical protein